MRAHVCVRVCVHACVHVRARACVRVCVYAELNQLMNYELRQKVQSLKNLSFQLSQEEGGFLQRCSF